MRKIPSQWHMSTKTLHIDARNIDSILILMCRVGKQRSYPKGAR